MNSGLKNCQVSANSVIIFKNMHYTSNFKHWERFSEKGYFWIEMYPHSTVWVGPYWRDKEE